MFNTFLKRKLWPDMVFASVGPSPASYSLSTRADRDFVNPFEGRMINSSYIVMNDDFGLNDYSGYPQRRYRRKAGSLKSVL